MRFGVFGACGVAPLVLLACGSTTSSPVGVDAGADVSAGSDAHGGSSSRSGTDAGRHDATQPSDTGTPAKDVGAPAKDTGTPAEDTGTPTKDAVAPPPYDSGPVLPPPTVDGGEVCGDGIIEGTEQCDDGNLFDLDGCDSHCNYEMVNRLTAFAISGAASPTGCMPTTNAIGTKVLTSAALGELNPPVKTDVTDATLNVFIDLLGLSASELAGTSNATGLTAGLLSGSLDPAKGTWPTTGTPPLDWWFLASHSGVSDGLPTAVLPASITGGTLTAGPGTVVFPLLGGLVTMNETFVTATINAGADVPASPPATLATGITVLETMTATTGQGLCGNVTVASLAVIPIPEQLTTGAGKCTADYTYCGAGNPVTASCSSVLDLFVVGCKLVGGLITGTNATQPDVAASGTVKTLTATGNKVPASQTTGDLDAYSLYATFATNRAHFTSQTCTATSDCQTGKTCSAAGECEPVSF